jgi:ABC-2 type transport system permease protein
MPKVLQVITRFIPARYFVNSMQTLFQAGNIASILLPNAFFLLVLAVLWLGNTARKTRRTLD